MSDGPTCRSCGEPCESDNCALPVDMIGRIVHNGFRGEWAGVPACRGCYNVHAAGGPDVLEAHVESTAQLREKLKTIRRYIGNVNGAMRDLNRFAEIDE